MKVKNSNFVDYVKIFCRSGKGGAGSVHLLRDRTTAKGGPDGGDGGRGGHIIIKGNEQMWTLLHLKYQKHIFAEHGGAGSGNNKIGKDGKSRILEVPLGTVAKDAETGEVLFEVTTHGEEQIILEGGKGECRLGIKKTNSIDWNYGFDAYAPLLGDFSIEKRFIF